jgi:hypothetical protein
MNLWRERRYNYSTATTPDAQAVAREFGVAAAPNEWRELEEENAIQIIESRLFVYNSVQLRLQALRWDTRYVWKVGTGGFLYLDPYLRLVKDQCEM